MIAVVNAGGSGSRLWPLSTPQHPKHLLSVTGEASGHSLMQDSYARVKAIADDVYVITEAGHADHVREQLPGVDDDHVIVEPARRGTASCLLIALHHIISRHGSDVPLVFMHADHVIHDVAAFGESVEHAARTSVRHGIITLLGVNPSAPSTGFGYIEKGERLSDLGASDVYRVASFKEKPDHATAVEYVQSGHYLWNMGYFAAPAGVFVETMARDAASLHRSYQNLVAAADPAEAYLELADIAIDYALMEPASELLVVPGHFDWVDVGNFDDLHSVVSQDESGNAVQGHRIEVEGVTNSLVRNDTDQKVAVVGLDNVVVVLTDNGVLVADRHSAHRVGEVAKRLW